MEIGQKLKEKRTAANLSQEELAAAVGVSRQTVSSWENNRSYPDIGSLLKLSDLYGASLDELLKEDPVMRKHVEDSASLPRKYWNLLYEIAILLLPFGSLAGYWGAPWVGLILRLIGTLMLPPLWVARYRLFGMSKDEMRKSIIGWVLCLAGSIVSIFEGSLGIIGYILLVAGLVMEISGAVLILYNGLHLERSTRFWLIIVLFLGIPVYILTSGMAAYMEDSGAFSEAKPFGYDYRIVDVEYGGTPSPTPTVELSMLNSSLSLDGEHLGAFSYIEPITEQTEKGIWQLIPEGSGNTMYKLVVSAEDKTTLAYYVDGQLQWRWKIEKVPTGQFYLRVLGSIGMGPMDWYPADRAQEPYSMNSNTFSEGHRASVRIPGYDKETLLVTEEYHWNGQVEIHEFQLHREKNGSYSFPKDFGKRYEGKGQYAIYSIEYAGGVFLYKLKFQ